jgi:hypothetical protein
VNHKPDALGPLAREMLDAAFHETKTFLAPAAGRLRVMLWTVEDARRAVDRSLRDSELPIEITETSVDGDDVVVVFVAAARPGCSFAFRYPAHEDGNQSAEEVGRFAVTNLGEELDAADRGLPECGPGELT